MHTLSRDKMSFFDQWELDQFFCLLLAVFPSPFNQFPIIFSLGEKSYNRKLKEDRNRGYDPRPEAFQLKSNEEIQEEIHEFLIACHDKKNPDKKTGKHIHSNFYCLYATMKLDEDEIEPEEPKLTPAEEKIRENWLLIESKFKDYVLDAEDLENEARSEQLGVLKK